MSDLGNPSDPAQQLSLLRQDRIYFLLTLLIILKIYEELFEYGICKLSSANNYGMY